MFFVGKNIVSMNSFNSLSKDSFSKCIVSQYSHTVQKYYKNNYLCLTKNNIIGHRHIFLLKSVSLLGPGRLDYIASQAISL